MECTRMVMAERIRGTKAIPAIEKKEKEKTRRTMLALPAAITECIESNERVRPRRSTNTLADKHSVAVFTNNISWRGVSFREFESFIAEEIQYWSGNEDFYEEWRSKP
jgi:hypothetical protein